MFAEKKDSTNNKGKRKGAGNRPSVYNQWVDMSIAPKTSKWRLSQRNSTSPESFSGEDSSLPQEDYSMLEDPLTTQHSEDVSSFEDISCRGEKIFHCRQR